MSEIDIWSSDITISHADESGMRNVLFDGRSVPGINKFVVIGDAEKVGEFYIAHLFGGRIEVVCATGMEMFKAKIAAVVERNFVRIDNPNMK